jgi:hypothetical protein
VNIFWPTAQEDPTLSNMEEQVQTQRQRLRENIKFLLIAGGGLFGDGYLTTTIGLGMYLFIIQSGQSLLTL